MNSIDLIIFDCDGVLVDSEIIGNRVYANYLTSLGLPHTPEECNERYLGMADTTVMAMFEADGITLPTDFVDEVHRLEQDAMERELEPIPRIGDALRAINVPKCVGSSGTMAKINRSLTKTGLHGHFAPHLFSAVHVEKGKPAPDLFLYAAKQMNADPGRTVVIEDSRAGVQAGVAAQMTVIGFTGGSHIRPGHDQTLRDCGAHHILGDMAKLPDLLGTL